MPTPTLSTAMAMATVAAPAMGTATPASTTDEGECRLLGPFALLVQAALGGLALLSLVYKRWRERPQRPVKIWFFDVSKQVFGSVLVHIANIFMSMLTSGRFSVTLDPGTGTTQEEEPYVPNPCSFYLLNLAIDTTLGIPILIILLRIITWLVSYTPAGKPAESIQSGYYGDPPRALWWLKQSVIYFIGLFGMKFCVLIIFLAAPAISKVGDWALGWTEGNEKLQIAFVMMIFPLIMNAMQYYIIDSFIKKKETQEADTHLHERLPSDDPDEAREAAESGSDSEEDAMKIREEEYDPDIDGQAPTVVGSGPSSRRLHSSGSTVPTGLFPKE